MAGAFGAVIELSALDGANGFKISGVAEGDRSGWSVAAAGDVNGDGLDDLLDGNGGDILAGDDGTTNSAVTTGPTSCSAARARISSTAASATIAWTAATRPAL